MHVRPQDLNWFRHEFLVAPSINLRVVVSLTLAWIAWSHRLVVGQSADSPSIEVPAFTAYIQPDWRAARVSESRGVTRWTDPKQAVVWYGKFATTGKLTAKVKAKLQPGDKTTLRLTISDQAHDATVAANADGSQVTFDFGEYEVERTGYQPLRLSSLDTADEPIADVIAMELQGAAVTDVHFNLKERRNAASVHVRYPVPAGTKVSAMACEVTAVEDPTMTFYMACGWHRGYFGMQVNSPTERRIIFSVWDSGNEAVDRAKVVDENRVRLVEKGPGVYAGDFGNEGTGGHSHLKVNWKTGQVQRFVVTAQPVEETFTVFSGYWYHPDDQKWMLISSWKAPKEGGWLRGLHSFSENFGGENGHLRRKALFGNQWARTDQGEWLELTEGKFSHDPTGQRDRFDRWMGVEGNNFFLSHGGFSNDFTESGTLFTRPALGSKPDFRP